MAASAIVDESELPLELDPFRAVEAAYPEELARAHEALTRGLPVMVECEKELTPYFYKCLRDRLKGQKSCVYLDGRAPPDPSAMPMGLIATMIAQLRAAVRSSVEQKVVVLPHLDLLTTNSGGLTQDAREVIPLLYENPEVLWLGFKDPSFPLPKTIENLFPHRESILGVPRERIRHLVTQREARKLGRGLNPYALYKFVSGVNAVRLRRILSSLTGEDYPADDHKVLAQLRRSTLGPSLSVPEIDLQKDIGGYAKVKEQLTREILDVMLAKDKLSDPEQIKRIEGLLPRGMIFWGPPGTGKTLFAKAMASALGAAVTVVSGPELKSKWVGESEENLRQIFVRARLAAPAIIVFDELDSFASARGTYTGSGVEHSMVNQLLTEMDGFRKDELVFVVGTTNFVESIDPALMRPGRFEFHLHIPYPGAADREAILRIYDHKLGLKLAPEALEYAVKRTGDEVEGGNTRHSGDHIQAICRALARERLRAGKLAEASGVAEFEAAMTKYVERPELTAFEEKVVASHEAGHAVVALFCDGAPPIERISIRGDLGGVLGSVRYGERANRHVTTRGELLDMICSLFGGREAEALLLDDLSLGSAADLERATSIARALVEQYGMGPDDVGARQFLDPRPNARPAALSDATREKIESAVRGILEMQRARARELLEQNRAMLTALRDLLLEKKVLDRQAFGALLARPSKKPEIVRG